MNMIKKGQVTIFIIIAIVIVAAVLLFIFLRKEVKSIDHPEENTKSFIQSCVKDAVEDSIKISLENGGQIVPSQLITYRDLNYNYLCYQADYYQPCYNIHPMLEAQIESEIKRNTEESVQKCFLSLKEDLERKGYYVSINQTHYLIDILPAMVKFQLTNNVKIVKEENSQEFKEFSGEVTSSLYELIRIARDIVNSESQFCNFEYNGYMLLYSQYDIKRADYEGTKLYNIINRLSKEEFRFAVRSCVFPPGI